VTRSAGRCRLRRDEGDTDPASLRSPSRWETKFAAGSRSQSRIASLVCDDIALAISRIASLVCDDIALAISR
jgi:hypothetical protein